MKKRKTEIKDELHGVIADTPEENSRKKIMERTKKLMKQPHVEICLYSTNKKRERRATYLGMNLTKKEWWKLTDHIRSFYRKHR